MDQVITEKIDLIFADVDREDSPGCAVGIVQDQELIYTRGFGMANLECSTPISATSIFHVASVSKQFTCMAILLLAAEGKLSIDDDVHTHIPELPDYGDVITLRHLVHHTSGLRDQWDLLRIAGWREDDVKTNEDMLYLACRQRALNFRPGDEFLYSNTGYTFLALIVERLMGVSFRAFTHARIFEPLGMSDTHFHDDHTELVVGRTSAYVPIGQKYQVKIPMFDTVGATSLFTTVEDLARWHTNFETGVVGNVVFDKMHERGILNCGKQITYAFGLSVDTHRGLKSVQHSGADAGYRSHFTRFPDQGTAIIVLSNLSTANPGGRVRQMTDVYFKDVLEPSPQSETSPAVSETVFEVEIFRADYVGTYYCADVDATYTVLDEDGDLVVRHYKRQKYVLDAEAEDVFRGKPESWKFQRSADGCVCGASVSTGRVRNLWFARRG
jgi:CubicO group peptidase (beta-lactamase class C family)